MGTVEISLDEYRRLIQRDTILDQIVMDAKEMKYMSADDVLKYFGTSKAKLEK